MNFLDVILFSAGMVVGVYLDQKYILPNVEKVSERIKNLLKQYEPPKKPEPMDIDN